MSEPGRVPNPYRVVYSDRVPTALLGLAARAREGGLGPQFVAAVKEIDRRLRIYPQFGQPVYNLKLEPAQVWIGVVPPLVVRYSLDAERRLVMVGIPILPLPRSGF
jgi:hypothetical protein